MKYVSTIVGVLIASTIFVAGAQGGTYQVSACMGLAPVTNESWVKFNSSLTYLETPSECGGGEVTGGSSKTSGLAAADVLELASNVPAGTVAGWEFNAPSGDTITAISMSRDLYDQSEGWVPQMVDSNGTALPGEVCPFTGGAGGCEISGAATHNGLTTTSLAIELLCEPQPFHLSTCANGFSQHDGRAELGGATVTLNDEQAPQITSVSGPLFAGGQVHGTVSGTINATDNSGVQYARVYADGVQVEQQSPSCDFARPAPCPLSLSSQVSLDTRTLSDGSHQIQAAVVDVAGNQTLQAPVQINVENAPPPTPPDAPSGATGSTGAAAGATPPPPPIQVEAGKESPGLRILSIKRAGRVLRVRGSAARTLLGRLVIVVRYSLAKRLYSTEKAVRVAHGAWIAILSLPQSAKTTRVRILYRGSTAWLSQTVTRYISHGSLRTLSLPSR